MSDQRAKIINAVNNEARSLLKDHLMYHLSQVASEDCVDSIVTSFMVRLNDQLFNSLELGRISEEMELHLPNGNVSTKCLLAALESLREQYSGTPHGHKLQYLKSHAEHVFNQR